MAMSVTYTTIGGVIVHEALSGGGERELTADPLGSLIKIRTSSANYSYSAEYWPYGEIQAQSGSNPTRWAFVGLLGYMRDLATMFYVRARYYRSALTRWMTMDPLWPIEAAYSYTSAAPTMLADPLGLQAVFHKPPGGIGPPSPPKVTFGDCLCDLMPTCKERFDCCMANIAGFLGVFASVCGILSTAVVGCISLCKNGLVLVCKLCLIAAGVGLACAIVAYIIWLHNVAFCRRAYLMCLGRLEMDPAPTPPVPPVNPREPRRTGGMLHD